MGDMISPCREPLDYRDEDRRPMGNIVMIVGRSFGEERV
jgi:hypothetical protein